MVPTTTKPHSRLWITLQMFADLCIWPQPQTIQGLDRQLASVWPLVTWIAEWRIPFLWGVSRTSFRCKARIFQFRVRDLVMCLRMIRVGESLQAIPPHFLRTLECSSRVLTSLDILDSLESSVIITRYYCRFTSRTQSWTKLGFLLYFTLLPDEAAWRDALVSIALTNAGLLLQVLGYNERPS